MAEITKFTKAWAGGNLLSKTKIGGTVYALKDKEGREAFDGLVAALKQGAYVDVATAIAEGNQNLATSDLVAKAVEAAADKYTQALIFRGVSSTDPAGGTVTINGDVLKARAGDVVLYTGEKGEVAKEFIYDGSKWEELGDQKLYATKAELTAAVALLVTKKTEIAGVAINDGISKGDLQAGLGLKALAYQDKGSVTVPTVASINDIDVVDTAAPYAVTNGTVSVPATYNALDVTPAGDIEVKAGKAATVTYSKAAASAVISSVETEENPNYTPAGTVSLPTVGTEVTLATESVDTVISAGTGYSITEGKVTQAESQGSNFNTDAMKAHVAIGNEIAGEVDAETLVFADAAKAEAITTVGAVGYTAPVLSGALPTFGSKNVAKATGATATTTFGPEGATFAGKSAKLSASIAHTTESATVTQQPTYTATFTGTTKNVTPSVATSSDVAMKNGVVTLTTKKQAITPVAGSKTVDVNFAVNP